MTTPTPLTSPVRTGNLVLKTRVDLVLHNLWHIQRALGTVGHRRKQLRQVLGFADRAEASIRRLSRALDRATEAWEDGSDDLQIDLNALRRELDKLLDEASDLKDPVGELRRAVAFDAQEVARTDSVANAVHEFLQNAVSAEFGADLANLETLRSKIDAGRAEDEADAGEMRAAWAQYSDQLYVSSERLFEEYVDLVSGVALRDTGFDRGIAQLAESLLRSVQNISNFSWNSLTVPAREESLAVTAARIVRLGFPEWTIWALPLTAYELGCYFADSDKQVAEVFVKLGTDRDELLVLAADAFATWFLGPAYACAAILMRLNPAEALTGNRLAAKRAATILSALAEASRKESGVEDHYAEITSRLAVEWEDALRQTGWDGPAAVGPADDAGAVTRSRFSWLTDDEQSAIDRLLHAFEPVVYIWIRLHLDEWPKVEEWAAGIRAGQDVQIGDRRDLAQLRYLLNAAWRARVAVRIPETDVDDEWQLAEIATTVERLLWDVVKAPKEPIAQSGPGQQRPPFGGLSYPSGRTRTGRETA